MEAVEGDMRRGQCGLKLGMDHKIFWTTLYRKVGGSIDDKDANAQTPNLPLEWKHHGSGSQHVASWHSELWLIYGATPHEVGIV